MSPTSHDFDRGSAQPGVRLAGHDRTIWLALVALSGCQGGALEAAAGRVALPETDRATCLIDSCQVWGVVDGERIPRATAGPGTVLEVLLPIGQDEGVHVMVPDLAEQELLVDPMDGWQLDIGVGPYRVRGLHAHAAESIRTLLETVLPASFSTMRSLNVIQAPPPGSGVLFAREGDYSPLERAITLYSDPDAAQEIFDREVVHELAHAWSYEYGQYGVPALYPFAIIGPGFAEDSQGHYVRCYPCQSDASVDQCYAASNAEAAVQFRNGQGWAPMRDDLAAAARALVTCVADHTGDLVRASEALECIPEDPATLLEGLTTAAVLGDRRELDRLVDEWLACWQSHSPALANAATTLGCVSDLESSLARIVYALRADTVGWEEDFAETVAAYYGKFPDARWINPTGQSCDPSTRLAWMDQHLGQPETAESAERDSSE